MGSAAGKAFEGHPGEQGRDAGEHAPAVTEASVSGGEAETAGEGDDGGRGEEWMSHGGHGAVRASTVQQAVSRERSLV